MNVVGDFEAILGLSSPVNHWHLLDKCGQLEMFSVWRVQVVRERISFGNDVNLGHRRIPRCSSEKERPYRTASLGDRPFTLNMIHMPQQPLFLFRVHMILVFKTWGYYYHHHFHKNISTYPVKTS